MLTGLLAIMILLGGSLGPRGKSPLLDRPTEPLQWDGGKQRGEAPPLPHVASPDDATSRQSRLSQENASCRVAGNVVNESSLAHGAPSRKLTRGVRPWRMHRFARFARHICAPLSPSRTDARLTVMCRVFRTGVTGMSPMSGRAPEPARRPSLRGPWQRQKQARQGGLTPASGAPASARRSRRTGGPASTIGSS
jgi:hypothetical protein